MTLRVLYFLEDRAQECLVRGLVRRVADEEGVAVEHDVRSAVRGAGRVMEELNSFVGSLPVSLAEADVLIVAVDANCARRATKEREIRSVIHGTGLEDRTVCCVPDPHIERWYVADRAALSRAVGVGITVSMPKRKCGRDVYKRALCEALKPVGSVLGGPEYGEDLARELDYESLRSTHSGFGEFVDDLRRGLRLSRA